MTTFSKESENIRAYLYFLKYFGIEKSPFPDSLFYGQPQKRMTPKKTEKKEKLERIESPSLVGGDVSQRLESELDNCGNLNDLQAFMQGCKRCRLHEGRTNLVFGNGNPHADIMLIGEGPGRDEDLQGAVFIGRSGQLLTKMLAAIHIDREDVYIGNIVKCRPPNNRDPKSDEIAICSQFLQKQISLIQPKILLALGRIAGQALLGGKPSLRQMRGTVHQYVGIDLVVTFHPAALLRNPAWKKEAWQDLQKFEQMCRDKGISLGGA